MDNRQWDDYTTRREGTFWGDYAREWNKRGQIEPPISNPPQGSGRNPVDSFVDSVSPLADWIQEHFLPLKWLSDLGESLMEVGWKTKASSAILGGFLLVSLTAPESTGLALPAVERFLVNYSGEWAPLAAFVIGGLLGWVAIPLLGGLLLGISALAALVLTLGVILLGFFFVYAIFKALL